MNRRKVVLILVTLLILGAVNVRVYQREELARSGRQVFLELVPVDPRSLFQGDYIQMRYALSADLADLQLPPKGLLLLTLDAANVAQRAELYQPGSPLGENQVLVRYQWGWLGPRIGPDSFFIQEGHARIYRDARFAELRVSPDGDTLLVGLRDELLRPLGPPKE
jgi:uncharacterized membrane-anchored protein